MRKVAALALLICAPSSATSQDAFPTRPLPPARELNLKWAKTEQFVVEQTMTIGQVRYRQGRTDDGYTYSIWSNGNAGLSGFGESWSIHCQIDAMSDQFNCYVASLTNTSIYVYFGASNAPQAVCVLNHDFPGRTAAIRVETLPPRETNAQGCVGPEIIPELTRGMVVRTRSWKWPYDHPVDRQGTLAGLNQSFALIRHLQRHFIKMNF